MPYGIRNCYAGVAGRDQIEDHADAPDESAEQSERVTGNRSLEISGKAYGLADQRFLHEINVPDQTREQRAEGEEDGNTVRTECVSVGHRSRHKVRPEAHQDSGDDAGDDALLRHGAARDGQAAIGFAVEHNGNECADDASS